MAQSICSIDACERTVWARGYCQRHYDLWRRRGSAEVEPIRVYGRVCPIEGCGRRARGGFGFCPMHYQRAKLGDPGDNRLRGHQKGYERGVIRPCWWCHKEFSLLDGRTLYCSPECAAFVKSLWNLGRYGITRDDYRDAWFRQSGLCAICRQPERTTRNHLLSVDHDHVTGRFRGLLCSHCNRALGMFSDDPATLRSAADYIERHRAALTI